MTDSLDADWTQIGVSALLKLQKNRRIEARTETLVHLSSFKDRQQLFSGFSNAGAGSICPQDLTVLYISVIYA